MYFSLHSSTGQVLYLLSSREALFVARLPLLTYTHETQPTGLLARAAGGGAGRAPVHALVGGGAG